MHDAWLPECCKDFFSLPLLLDKLTSMISLL
jgi:hypothetical protein